MMMTLNPPAFASSTFGFVQVTPSAGTTKQDPGIHLVGPDESQTCFFLVFSENAVCAVEPSRLVTVYQITIICISFSSSIKCVHYFIQNENSQLMSACQRMKKSRNF
jgi:hypothetical protein